MSTRALPAPRRRLIALAVAVLVGVAALAGCGSDGGGSSATSPEPDVRAAPTTTAFPASTSSSIPTVADLDGVQVGYEEVATFDDTPMAMAVRPGDDGVVYVALRGGRLVRLDPTAGPDAQAGADTVLDFTDDVSTESERGFLGVAFAPDGEQLYVSYTNPDGDTRIDEYAVDGTGAGATVDAGSRREVLAVDQPYPNHNGGGIAFGPDDLLYVGLGDGGAGGDPEDRAQDPTSLLGKVLRIDPAAGEESTYGIPEDNPNVGGANGTEARSEIWLRGVRNPWRWSFDSATGDLWIADVGQDSVEEIDFLPQDGTGRNAGRAANLGWNEMEGDQPYEGGEPPSGYVPPIATYTHDDGGCSVTGGYVYRGAALPELEGAYLYTDYCRGHLQGLVVDGSREIRADEDLGALPQASPVSFGQDADGELYVLFQGGQLVRITAG